MFRYPSGRNLMNTIIWLVGATQFAIGVLIIILGVISDGGPALSNLEQLAPQLEIIFNGGLLFAGIFVCIMSFPTLIFAEVHMYSRQNNKMMKKMYDRLKN